MKLLVALLLSFAFLSEGVCAGVSLAEEASHQVSTLPYGEASALFQEILQTPDIPFYYESQGCEAKAHFVALFFDRLGLKVNKVFIEGNLFWNRIVFWTFHVAPGVMIEKDGVTELYVFDPLVSKKPIPKTQWLKRVTHHKYTKVKDVYETSRFVYSPLERHQDLNHFDEYFINDMYTVFEVIRKRTQQSFDQKSQFTPSQRR